MRFIPVLSMIITAPVFLGAHPITTAPKRVRPVTSAYPAWSPDGQRIAFQSNRTGDVEIYVMNVDGSNVVRLTDNDGLDVHPSWSPDGKHIAFGSVRNASTSSGAGRMHLYVMDADGQHQTRITNDIGEELMPEWSPDGSRIAFLSNRSGVREAYVSNADGSGITPVTPSVPFRHTEVGNPHWTADGTRLVFDADYRGTYDLFSLRLEGTDLQPLTKSPPASGAVFFPSMSRDGSRLAFCRSVGEFWNLIIAQPDGTREVNITPSVRGNAFWPSWSPDGRHVAFTLVRGDTADVYTIGTGGSGLTQLTRDAR